MTTQKLMDVLHIVEHVKSSKWNTVLKILDVFDEVQTIEKKWGNETAKPQDIYPLDLSNIDTWSTYEYTCIDLTFKNEGNNLTCFAKIYDGDNLYGDRGDLKFTAKLKLPNSFVQILENLIIHRLDEVSKQAYEYMKEVEKRNWIQEFKNRILEN